MNANYITMFITVLFNEESGTGREEGGSKRNRQVKQIYHNRVLIKKYTGSRNPSWGARLADTLRKRGLSAPPPKDIFNLKDFAPPPLGEYRLLLPRNTKSDDHTHAVFALWLP